MLGVEDGTDRKRTVEIRFSGGPQRQTANEHSSGTGWVEIVRIGGRYGNNVGSARGTGNIDRAGGWIRQVHGREKSGSARSDIGEARPRLEGNLRVGAGVQRDICDGAVG